MISWSCELFLALDGTLNTLLSIKRKEVFLWRVGDLAHSLIIIIKITAIWKFLEYGMLYPSQFHFNLLFRIRPHFRKGSF